jgi:hypothetical protein
MRVWKFWKKCVPASLLDSRHIRRKTSLRFL